MPNTLFGLNIARIVDDAIREAGGVGTGTLIKRENGTRTPGNLAGGRNPTSTSYSFRGFIENRSDEYRGGTLVSTGGQFVLLLGNSLPSGVVPEAGDQITIEGADYELLDVTDRDPAKATYSCRIAN